MQKQQMINAMPTLLTIFGIRFFFYSREHEPIHEHVEHADGKAKFNLGEDAVELVECKGLKTSTLKLAESILEENRIDFIAQWKATFNG